jgi:hypothetical protein
MTTIVTLQHQWLLILHIELGNHRFVTIANTCGISAFNNPFDDFRQFNLQLLYDTVVTDYVYGSMRRHESDAIDLTRT